MKLIQTILLLLLYKTSQCTNVVNITNDTTVTGTWNLSGSILRISAKISGTCIITNAKIEANPFIQIFDTTVTLGTGVYIKEFSAVWYGASGSKPDNYSALQKSINACINTTWPLYIPGGQAYTYSTPLFAGILNGSGNYDQVRVRIYGDASFWNSSAGTTLRYTGDSFALGLQVNKGSEISNLVIQGGWISPSPIDKIYYNLSLANYTNQGLSGNGQGICIDPYQPATGTTGSTGIKIHDIKVEKFATLVKISKATTQNAEIIKIENIQLGEGRIGIEGNQPQEKGNTINGVYSWGRIHTLFSTLGGGNYYVDYGNVAGKCVRLFNISTAGWFPVYISNFYCEGIGSIGTFLCGLTGEIRNSSFDFADSASTSSMSVFTGNNARLKFTNCVLRYFGASYALPMTGIANFNNCAYQQEGINGLSQKTFVEYGNGTMVVSGSIFQSRTDTVRISNVKVSVKIN